MGDSNTAVVTKVAASASSISLLAANGQRKPGSAIYNDSSSVLYLLFGTGTASNDNWTFKMNQDDVFQVPDGYTGAVQGIWVSATGQARVTEVL